MRESSFRGDSRSAPTRDFSTFAKERSGQHVSPVTACNGSALTLTVLRIRANP
jgi:hypothetical protein